MSYINDVKLKIFTFLEGERKVDKPIHKTSFKKPLKEETVNKAVDLLANEFLKRLK